MNLPKFIFSENSHIVKVKLARSETDKHGIPLCELSWHICLSKKEEYWRIISTEPTDLIKYIPHTRFPNKEIAAQACFAIIESVQNITTQRPLPEDINNYLEMRARNLRQEYNHCAEQMMNIRIEQDSLNRFAKRNQISNLEHWTSDGDSYEAVKRLLSIKDNNDIPLFSEKSLYELLGKDTARTLLTQIRKVCELVSPQATEETMGIL